MFTQRLAGGKYRIWHFYPIFQKSNFIPVFYLDFVVAINSIWLNSVYNYAQNLLSIKEPHLVSRFHISILRYSPTAIPSTRPLLSQEVDLGRNAGR